MAFDITVFNPAGGQSYRGKAPQKWTYTTTDSGATIDTSGYFNGASKLLEVGDIIEVVTTTSGVPSAYTVHIVMSNASDVVDVSNTLASTALSDTD